MAVTHTITGTITLTLDYDFEGGATQSPSEVVVEEIEDWFRLIERDKFINRFVSEADVQVRAEPV